MGICSYFYIQSLAKQPEVLLSRFVSQISKQLSFLLLVAFTVITLILLISFNDLCMQVEWLRKRKFKGEKSLLSG